MLSRARCQGSEQEQTSMHTFRLDSPCLFDKCCLPSKLCILLLRKRVHANNRSLSYTSNPPCSCILLRLNIQHLLGRNSSCHKALLVCRNTESNNHRHRTLRHNLHFFRKPRLPLPCTPTKVVNTQALTCTRDFRMPLEVHRSTLCIAVPCPGMLHGHSFPKDKDWQEMNTLKHPNNVHQEAAGIDDYHKPFHQSNQYHGHKCSEIVLCRWRRGSTMTQRER